MKKTATKILHLPVLVEQDEDSYFIVICPVFKGCHSYGKTIDDALLNIQEVIEMCLDEEKEKSPSAINHFIGFREIQVPFKTISA